MIYEIKLIAENDWNNLNIESLFIELTQAGIHIQFQKLEISIRNHLIEQYNPIREYFRQLPTWDGQNHIQQLCSYVSTNDDKAFYYQTEKWFARAVICALEKEKINKHCLILTNTIKRKRYSSEIRYSTIDEIRFAISIQRDKTDAEFDKNQ